MAKNLTLDFTLPHVSKLFDAPLDHYKTFKSEEGMNLPDCFNRALSQISIMIEMDYIHVSHDGQLTFSSAGVNNMHRNHSELVSHLFQFGLNGDYGRYDSLVGSILNASPSSDFSNSTSIISSPESLPYGSIDPEGPHDYSAIPPTNDDPSIPIPYGSISTKDTSPDTSPDTSSNATIA